jgi:hypothetical protein
MIVDGEYPCEDVASLARGYREGWAGLDAEVDADEDRSQRGEGVDSERHGVCEPCKQQRHCVALYIFSPFALNCYVRLIAKPYCDSHPVVLR